jgi:hypothetical protein
MHIQQNITRLGFAIGALLIASGCNGASTGDPALDEAERTGEVEQAQFPVNTYVGKLEFIHVSTPVLHIVLTSNALPTGSTYQSDREYWVGSDTSSIQTMTSLTMGYTTMTAPTDTLIGNYLTSEASFGAPFVTAQTISTSDWSRSTYSSGAAKKRLFKATDPDDAGHHIGLLIEQNSSNGFTGAVWFKTNDTGYAFSTMPSSLAFTAVTDAYNNSSLDPADIERGVTWYHYAEK